MQKIINQFFLSLVCIVLFIALSAETTPTVTPTPPLQTLPANCYSTVIQLNGDNPATITCKVPGKVVNGQMVPYVNGQILSTNSPKVIVDCTTSTYNAEINTKAQNYCFTGTGYVGFKIIQGVTRVQNFSNYNLWFMYYHGGPSIKSYLQAKKSEGFNPTVGVTQMCIKC